MQSIVAMLGSSSSTSKGSFSLPVVSFGAAAVATGAAAGTLPSVAGLLAADASGWLGRALVAAGVGGAILFVGSRWQTSIVGLPRWWWGASPGVASWLVGMMVGLALPIGVGRKWLSVLGASLALTANPVVGMVVGLTLAGATGLFVLLIVGLPGNVRERVSCSLIAAPSGGRTVVQLGTLVMNILGGRNGNRAIPKSR